MAEVKRNRKKQPNVKNSLQEILIKKNIQQLELVKALDISDRAMSAICTNTTQTTIGNALKIANYLGMDVGDIFYLDEE